MACFGLIVSPVLTQNEDIGFLRLTDFEQRETNFIFGLWYAIVSNMTDFDHNALSCWRIS